jgi:hypothetical protein
MMREERLSEAVTKVGRFAAVGLIIGLPLPLIVGVGDASYLVSLIAIGTIIGLCTLAHDREERPIFLALFAIALTIRFYAQLALYKWAIDGGGPFLNADATLYLHRSLFLAADNFEHGLTPALYFGTYDCAHYYLFAALIKYAGADMYGLQMFNAGLTAMIGSLVYGALRATLPRYALPLGVVVALSPTLIAYGVNDLLKDPGVIASAMLTIWAISRLWRAEHRPVLQVCLIAAAAVALGYSRMSRFYVAPFFAVAFIGAWIATRLPNGGPRPHFIPRSRFALSVVAIFLIAEVVPMRLGWPPSTVMVAEQVASTLNTPAMRVYAKGLFDRAATAPIDPPQASKYVSRKVDDILRDFNRGARLPSALEAEQAAERERALEKPIKSEGNVSLSRQLVSMGANGVRKFFGPFPWVMPLHWDPKSILASDFLLFPGMLLWYAVLPLGLGGGVFVVWRAIQRRSVPVPLLIAGGIVGVFLAQYLVLNLSWRQREFIFPFLAVLACFAIEHGWGKPMVRYGYAAYWTLLVLMAITHLSVRAFVALT